MGELRIVAGAWRGRLIAVPSGPVRPTAHKVREAWLSIVHPALDGARVADLCAGSGALGLDALSRGAEHCDFVEKAGTVLKMLEANISVLGAAARAAVHRGEAVAFVTKEVPDGADPAWGVAFADPPYREGVAVALAERWLRAPFATIFGVEHEVALTLPPLADGSAPDRRVYGETALTFYRLPN